VNGALAWWQALVLGFVQGLTEILPVSSSAHLALAEAWLDAPGGAGFAALVRAGTLLAIGLVLREPVRELVLGLVALPRSLGRPLADWNARALLAGKVVAATIPAAVVALLFRGSVERAYASTDAIAGYLIVTALVLGATRWAQEAARPVGWRSAMLVGWAQACAILPGLSRSGTTIAVALLLGVGRARAAEFSFLAAIPLILGSMMLDLRGVSVGSSAPSGSLAAGFLASFAAGALALPWLLRAVRRGRVHWFAAWCIAAAAVLAGVPRL
jgi:undecaprenyl-diphosphatase